MHVPTDIAAWAPSPPIQPPTHTYTPPHHILPQEYEDTLVKEAKKAAKDAAKKAEEAAKKAEEEGEAGDDKAAKAAAKQAAAGKQEPPQASAGRKPSACGCLQKAGSLIKCQPQHTSSWTAFMRLAHSLSHAPTSPGPLPPSPR